MAPVSDLTAHVGYWLRYVSNHVSHAFSGKLAGKDVTVAEWVLLRTLYGKAPTPPSRLADDVGMTRGAVTKLADRLIAKALIARRPSATDGRAQTLVLTAQGKRLVPELAQLADRNDAEFFDHLSTAERRTLLRQLKRMVARGGMTTMPTD